MRAYDLSVLEWYNMASEAMNSSTPLRWQAHV